MEFSSLISRFTLVAFLLLTACDPVPRRVLTTEEKLADLAWIYSQFGENYAPLEYKQKRLNFDYESVKAATNEAAKATTNNDEFYALAFKFVSTFQDAHASGTLTNATLPNRGMVAYTGFSGQRDGETLFVQNILPTIDPKTDYPILKGDRILQIDGRLLRAAVTEDLVPWRNLGNAEANFTYHANKLFTRVSTVNGIPAADNVTLRVKRGDKEFDVTLPWVKKDLYLFQVEQAKAKEEADKKKPASASDANLIKLKGESGEPELTFRLIGFDGRPEFPVITAESISRTLRKSVDAGFRFIDAFARWELVGAEKAEEKTIEERVREIRFVPEGAVFLTSAKVYPTYVAREESGLVGTILLDTFSPLETPQKTLAEFKQTLLDLQLLGAERVVIDMINNGGGSLLLGFQLAQALSAARVELPSIQFRVSDSWLDQFEKSSMNAKSDSEREISRRVFEDLKSTRQKGERLSPVYNSEVIAPFIVKLNDKIKKPFRIALVVNEMCASMCDIFAGMMQDAQLVTIVGTNSMGAGGNVVGYNQAPNSHFDVRQTESLILRKDGSYIENVGVKPDVEIAVANHTATKYKEVREAAIKALK